MSDESNSENQSQNNSSSATNNNRRQFLKYAAVGAVGVGIASAVEIPVLTNMANGENIKLQEANDKISQLNAQLQQDQSQINGLNSQVSNLNSEVSSLQAQQAGSNGIIDLSISEQKELEAIVEAIIPSDSSGPGAKEAGVIYFIARQIGTDYGTNAKMYMQAPFIRPGISGPITVDNITYSAGTQDMPWQAGMQYQYNLSLRDFWRYGLEALQNYTNSVLGKNFEDLDSSDQVQILNDLYDNKPTDFNGIVPKDFFQELIFLTWSGFFMDPMYGGNQGLEGWKLTGFTGANMSNAFGDGQDPTKLMVADKPTRYSPHSLGEYQQTLKIIGGS
jgi:gluconate 2-dehydrogenase gamma chain